METPERIGKYEILGKLGAGGMAEVFLARHTGAAGFEKKVALKRLASSAVGDELLIKSLINEANLVAQLSHPNLVQVFEFELIDHSYCMSMEWVNGVTLDEILNRCYELQVPLPRGLIIYLATEICSGLDYAHSVKGEDGDPLGLVHRDIKPSNIMISHQGQVKIMDFGIAKAASNPYKTTRSGAVKGTLAYMSPEQLAAAEPLLATSDLFSLGVILYEAATLECLFPDTNLLSLATAIQMGLRPEARERLTAWFPELVPIVSQLLEFDAEKRPSDARTLIRALRPLTFNSTAIEMSEFLQDLGLHEGYGESHGPATMSSVNSGTNSPFASQKTAQSDGNVPMDYGHQPTVGGSDSVPLRQRPATAFSGVGGSARASAADGRSLPARAPVPFPSGPQYSGMQPAPGSQTHPPQAGGGPYSGSANPSSHSPPGGSVLLPAPEGIRKRHLALTAVGAILVTIAVFFFLHLREEKRAPANTHVADSTMEDGRSQSRLLPGGQAALPAKQPITAAAPESTGPSDTISKGKDAASVPPKVRALSESSANTQVASKPQKTAARKSHNHKARKPSVARGVGALVVNSIPWAVVYVDGAERGNTPMNTTLPVGTHTIKLIQGDTVKEFQITLKKDAQLRRVWSFKSGSWVQ